MCKKFFIRKASVLDIFSGHKKKAELINIHWNSFVPLVYKDAIYTIEAGIVWRHRIDLNISKKVLSFDQD